MNIDPGIINCVGFIGAPTPQGFVADGTCFFVGVWEETEAFLYMVTARHLVRPAQFGNELLPIDGIVKVRVSRKTNTPLVFDTIRGEWECHPDRFVDVCVRLFDHRRYEDGELLLSALGISGESSIIPSEARWAQFGGKPAIGDEIFIPSLFPGHVGEKRNIPVVRFGHVAAQPVETIRAGSPTVPAYLVETKSLGGVSGAPVFLHLQPYRMRQQPSSDGKAPEGGNLVPYALIGMVLGSHSGRYATDFVSDEDAENIVAKDADFNAGLSVVLPIQHVVDVLHGNACKEARLATLESIKKQSGYRPSSVSQNPLLPATAGPRQTTTPDIPDSDQERFTSLLNVAAKKKPQAD